MRRDVTDHVEREVRIPAGEALLAGDLAVPAGAKGIVLFAHGSGSSRHSPRNVWVASRLSRDGIATLLFDLLTADEEARDLWIKVGAKPERPEQAARRNRRVYLAVRASVLHFHGVSGRQPARELRRGAR